MQERPISVKWSRRDPIMWKAGAEGGRRASAPQEKATNGRVRRRADRRGIADSGAHGSTGARALPEARASGARPRAGADAGIAPARPHGARAAAVGHDARAPPGITPGSD